MLQPVVTHPVRFLMVVLSVWAVFAWSATRAAGQRPGKRPQNSQEMKRLYDEDQADREINMAAMTIQQRTDWSNKIGPRDAQRRKQVTELIERDSLQTGDDFEEAAFVFQHGDRPEDFLLAHTLATVAVAKGSSKSRWISAATLDRYLHRIQQPQIYGTQYFVGPNKGDKFTQEPYNRQLISDALRRDMCVPEQAAQQRTVDLLNSGKEPTDEPKTPGC